MIQLLIKNWAQKLFALVLAIGLWNYALGEEGIQIERTVPLKVEVKNKQLSLVSTSTHFVKVTLNAPRDLLSEMTSGEIEVLHEIGEDVKVTGEYSFRIEHREVKLPKPQIRVIMIEPEVVQLTLDELIVQKMKIEPNFVGEPAFGYDVMSDEVQLDPNAVMIEGPKGQIGQLVSVFTEPLDLVGRIRSFRRTVSLSLPPNVKPVNEAMIDAYIPIREQFEEKTFEAVTLKILRGPKSERVVSAEPSAVSFALKGSLRQLERLMPENVLAYVDASQLSAGEHDAEVKLVLPEGVSLREETPISVKVVVA